MACVRAIAAVGSCRICYCGHPPPPRLMHSTPLLRSTDDCNLSYCHHGPLTLGFNSFLLVVVGFFYLTNVGTGIALLHKLNLQDPFSEIVIQCCDTGGRWRWHWLIFSVAIAAGNWSKDLEAFVGRVHVTTCKTFSQFKITNFCSWKWISLTRSENMPVPSAHPRHLRQIEKNKDLIGGRIC